MQSIPKHIAIIMDGNGRWAKARFMPKSLGHSRGAKVAESIARYAKEIGVEYLTLYAFSSENWQRPRKEIESIMQLLRNNLQSSLFKIIEEGGRIIFIGDRKRLDSDIQEKMEQLERDSRKGYFNLIIALSYGARDEITQAARAMSSYCSQNQVDPDTIDLENFINPNKIPDPDLLIRTSGECRVSNFMLWQIAYTELYFTQKLWPDFGKEDLMDAIKEYNNRERRYGR